jgi:hypothetical protein
MQSGSSFEARLLTQGVAVMNARNLSIAFLSAIVGGIAVAVIMSGWIAVPTAKSDRLSGPSTETAFLPERFGVPGATPTVK